MKKKLAVIIATIVALFIVGWIFHQSGNDLIKGGIVSLVAAQETPDYLLDSDGDGCKDVEELGPVASIGGQRNPQNSWDFFDLNQDKIINIIEIGMVVNRFGVTQTNPLYNPQYDRAVVGPNNWNLGPGDGVINILDIAAVVAQYGHRCGPFLYFLQHPENYAALAPPEPPMPDPPPPDDPNKPQTPPEIYGEGSETLPENMLQLIATGASNLLTSPITATENELPISVSSTFSEYFRQNAILGADERVVSGALVCNLQTGDIKVNLPAVNYLFGAGFGCEPGELDYAEIHITLQRYDWGAEVWRNETFLGEGTWYDESRALIWGALKIPPYYGVNCKRIRAHFLLRESGDDDQHIWQYSSGECY